MWVFGGLPGFGGRHGHVAAAYGSAMIVFGGEAASCSEGRGGMLRDIWAVDFSDAQWRDLDPVDALHPSGRSGMGAAVVNSSLYIYGGLAHGRHNRELWRFDVQTRRWAQLLADSDRSPNAPAPSPPCGGAGALRRFATPSLDATARVAQQWGPTTGELRLPVSGAAGLAISCVEPGPTLVTMSTTLQPRTLVIGGSRREVISPFGTSLQMSQFEQHVHTSGHPHPYYSYLPPKRVVDGGRWFSGLAGHTAGRVVVFGGLKATPSGLIDEGFTTGEVWEMVLQPLCHRGATCIACPAGTHNAAWGGTCDACPPAHDTCWMCEPCPTGSYQPSSVDVRAVPDWELPA
eukprot:gene30637-5496_t